MPHSSGGGSHRSGTHHSSGHSSHSSGGHHSSGGYTTRTSLMRIQSAPFLGARRYVRYTNHQAEYIYSDKNLLHPWRAKYLWLIIIVPIIAFIIFGLFNTIFPRPKKVKVDYTPSVMIEDTCNLIDDGDEVALQSIMDTFFDETGISVCVLTTNNEKWETYYPLMRYAYDEYVNRFPDEKHWLLIYSEPELVDENFSDWYFEGMQGDDTDKVITEQIVFDFTERLNRNLTDRSHFTVGSAFQAALEDCLIQVKTVTVKTSNIVILLYLLGVMLFITFFVILRDPEKKKYKDFIPCGRSEELVQEDTCDYCGGIYIIGTVLSCPHCNAPLKPHTYYKEK